MRNKDYGTNAMSRTRLEFDFERMQTVWRTARKLAQHPTLEGLVSRVVLFSQPEPQRASLVERLVAREPRLYAQIVDAVEIFVPGDMSFREKTMMLGDAKTSEVVLAICYRELVRSLAPLAGLDSRSFYMQSAAVGSSSSLFAERSCRFPPFSAFGAGLFYHLGILLMALSYHQSYRGLIDIVRVKNSDLATAETMAYGFSHAEAGVAIGDAWSLPGHIVDGICYHEQDSAGQKSIALCVALASRFSESIGYDGGLRLKPSELQVSSLRAVGVSEHNLERVTEAVRGQTDVFSASLFESEIEAA